MNPDAIPSFVSTLFLWTLCIISVSYRQREKVNTLFSLFTLSLSLTTLTSFLFYNSESVQQAYRWSRFAFVFAVPTAIIALFYVLEIGGYPETPHTRLFGLPVRAYPVLILISGAVLELLALFTPWIISGVKYFQPRQFEHSYGPAMSAAVVYFLFIAALVLILLYRSYKTSPGYSKRVLLKFNLFGFLGVFLLFGFMRLVLPMLHIRTYSLSFIPITLSAVVFILAILRYQFSQIVDLNRNLEMKVAERTLKLRQTQARLVQSGKMEALAELVAGISHEINNPLAVVQNNRDVIGQALSKLQEQLEQCLEQQGDSRRLKKILDVLANVRRSDEIAVNRLRDTVKNLQTFARLDRADIIRTHIRDCVESALSMLEHELHDRIVLKREYADNPVVVCRASHLNQAFLNIFLNAIQAIDGVGEITVHSRLAGAFVQVRIHDTGHGIPPENLGKIFDPGFTTKGVGVGTGLGLAITYEIVQKHGGHIFVDSVVGRGTTFTVEIPLGDPEHMSGPLPVAK